jgi:methionine-rich copper-binding protein CopC
MSKLTSALLVSAFAAVLSAGSAQAHSALIASTPAAHATVAAPSAIELHYNEKLKSKSRVELFMTGAPGKLVGNPAQIGVSVSVGGNGKTLVAKPQKPLAKGSYLIAWHVIAADGDRTDGTVRFAVR